MKKETFEIDQNRLKETFEIDQNRLDEEWVNQPTLFFKYAKKLAEAKQDLDDAKNHLNVTHAEISKDIRETPEDFDLAKVTEKAIESLIPLEEQYVKAQVCLTKAKYKVDIYQAAVTALEHRKSALQNLVSLHGQNYFSTPIAKGEDREAMEEIEKKTIRSRRKGRRNG